MYHWRMPKYEDDLYELLQSKKAEEVANNEDISTVGTTHLYDAPEDRVDGGQSNSPWGEAGPTLNGHPQADHQSDGAWEEHKTVRQGVLDNILDGRSKANEADQKLIAENFEHGASGDFTTHSVHLQGKSVEKVAHPRTPTLMSQVLKVAGRL